MRLQDILGYRLTGLRTLVLLCLGMPILVGSCGNQGTRYSFEAAAKTPDVGPLADAAAGALPYTETIESRYDALLTRYVDDQHLVRYESWLKSSADLTELKTVLASMSGADVAAMSADLRKAFYINAYNAMTLDLILSHFDETLGDPGSPLTGVRSIRNIAHLDNKVWDGFRWSIARHSVTLNEIENKILRPLGDARIHFAIVCASKGCPPLSAHAMSGAQLGAELDALADAFVNSGRSTMFEAGNSIIRTSHILDWFKKDFETSFGSVSGFLKKYFHAQSGVDIDRSKLQFYDYDWSLNLSVAPAVAQPGPAPSAMPSPPPGGGSGTERDISFTTIPNGSAS